MQVMFHTARILMTRAVRNEFLVQRGGTFVRYRMTAVLGDQKTSPYPAQLIQ